MRFFGTSIAYGLSSEARVFAGLLRHRGDAYEPTVFYNRWPERGHGIQKFTEISRADVRPMDFGWRPNSSGARPFFDKITSAFRFRLTLPRLLREAEALRPDVIYSCQQAWDCYAASYVAKRLGKPQVIHLHYAIGPWLGSHTLERLKTCDHVVTISDFIGGLAREYGVAPKRLTVIRNTMTVFPPAAPDVRARIRAEMGFADDAPVIGIVARLAAGKGVEDTIAAFTALAAQRPAARLLLVGGGPLRSALQAQTQATGFAERIRFTGPRQDIADILMALDIFVHPSRHEPFGLAVAEASASGLPVVALQEGGTPEIVMHQQTGLLTPPEDIPALSAALLQLADDPALAKRMGEAGRRRIAEDFRPEAAGRAFAELLTTVNATERSNPSQRRGEWDVLARRLSKPDER